jgi:hypothetical protein
MDTLYSRPPRAGNPEAAAAARRRHGRFVPPAPGVESPSFAARRPSRSRPISRGTFEGLDVRPQPHEQIADLLDALAETWHCFASDDVLIDREQEVLFAPEVLVERPYGHLGAIHDILDGKVGTGG